MTLWGSVHPLVKLALHELAPAQLIFLRVSSAAIVLLGVSLASGRGRLLLAQLRSPWPPLVGGLFGYLLTMNLSTYSLQYVPAAVNAMLINLSPIFTVLLGALLLGEPLTARGGLGALAGFLGVGMVTLAGQDVGGLGPQAAPGVLIGLVGAFFWAAYTVGMRRLARLTIDPLAATTLAAIGAAVILALLPGASGAPAAFRAASRLTQASVLWTGALATGGSFVVWAWALARMRAARVAAFQYLVAPIALLLAWPILGERPSFLLVFGMGLVLLGVGVAQRR
jgi:drug/metabolite transporter (DMT)-like permease